MGSFRKHQEHAVSWTDANSVPPPPRTGGDILRGAPKWVQVLLVSLIVIWVIMVLAMLFSASFNLFGFVVQLPILAAITVPIARGIARRDRDPETFWFVMAAFAAKMIGALTRYYFSYVVYTSAGDAEEYNAYGKYLVGYYRSLDFSPDVGQVPGTGFLKMVTGILYSVAGTSKIGAFMVFGWLGFIGLLLLWRAFKKAVPTGDAHRYGLLVLFLPSLLYWSSSLGKDAWCVFGLGVCSYGVARVMTRKRASGLAILVVGMAAVLMVRPHVALIVGSGLVLAALLYKPSTKSPLNPIVRVITFGLLLVMMLVLISQTQKFLGVDNLNQETVDSQLARAEGRTVEAGSVFTPVRVNTPLDLPYATATVLFRPFPYEAHNTQSQATAVEGVFLIVLTIRSWRRLRSIPGALRREPYTAYCLGILGTFVFAFSSFSNFGILARQRCQVMPFFLVLICLSQYKSKTAARLEEITRPGDIAALGEKHPNPYARFEQTSEESPADSRPSEHG
ncbi:MAG: hypothetical protein ACXVKA_04020 [Acidimicrobiia bacterium]